MSHSTAWEFLDQTKLCNLGACGREQGEPMPDFEQNPQGAGDILPLPAPQPMAFPALDVAQAIGQRESVREYAAAPMSLQELSVLLWYSQGIKRVIPGVVALRNVPSAGARNALETFVLVNRVEGLDSDLYKYVALDHGLLRLGAPENPGHAFALACDDQEQVRESNVTFFWTAVPRRMTWSYGDRGYRYLWLDAGHACQNLYLAAEKLQIGVCAIGHFEDDRLNALLGLDGRAQFALYAAAAGKKQEG